MIRARDRVHRGLRQLHQRQRRGDGRHHRHGLAIPPSVPDCSNIAPPGGGTPRPEFFWSQQANIPVPPLSSEGLGDSHDAGGKGVYSQSMCSPGTAASVKSFMSTELGKRFTAANQPECGAAGWVVKGNLAISWNVSDPKNWSLSYCQ